MPPISSGEQTQPPLLPRIICYHQTHSHNGQPISLLPLLTEKTAVTHVIIAAIHLNNAIGDITLNDDPYEAPRNEAVWQEVRMLQRTGIKVLGMLGGAAKGTFTRLDGNRTSFDAYYAPLRHMIQHGGFDGLDLDVEEPMSLAGIIRLIDQLQLDFSNNFIITLAPVAAALQNKRHISGFDYEELEKAFGHKIAWYNTQFYCGWGSMESTLDYDEIMKRGWPASKVVVGLITNPESELGWVEDEELRYILAALLQKYPGFAGVMGWEYFNSITVAEPFGWPWSWANLMTDILRPFDPARFDQSRAHKAKQVVVSANSQHTNDAQKPLINNNKDNPFAVLFEDGK